MCIDLTVAEIRTLEKSGFHAKVKCVSYMAESAEVSRHEQMRYEYQHLDYQYTPHPNLSTNDRFEFLILARRCSLTRSRPNSLSIAGMQNLSISCSLVCLIILGSAALLGAFGVCQRQISAILVTGVMYLLAGKSNRPTSHTELEYDLTNKQYCKSTALFALFTLMIIHFKRQQRRPLQETDFDGTFDGIVSPPGAGRAAQHLLMARQFATSWSLDLGWGGVVFCAITYILWIMLSKIMRYNPLSALLM